MACIFSLNQAWSCCSQQTACLRLRMGLGMMGCFRGMSVSLGRVQSDIEQLLERINRIEYFFHGFSWIGSINSRRVDLDIIRLMVLKVKVSGKEYQIEEELKGKMKFFAKVNIIEKIQADQVIEINTIEIATWEDLLKICGLVKNQFPAVAKVKTNRLADLIGEQLANYLNSKSHEELNDLYRAAQILEIQQFRTCIVACLASRVYVSRNLNDFKLRMTELKIKNEPSEDNVKEMRGKYAFLH